MEAALGQIDQPVKHNEEDNSGCLRKKILLEHLSILSKSSDLVFAFGSASCCKPLLDSVLPLDYLWDSGHHPRQQRPHANAQGMHNGFCCILNILELVPVFA